MEKMARCKIALMKLTEQWSPRWQSIGVRMTFWDYSAERFTWGKDYSSRTWGKDPTAFGIMFETQPTQPVPATRPLIKNDDDSACSINTSRR
jgi:hypothetical protein